MESIRTRLTRAGTTAAAGWNRHPGWWRSLGAAIPLLGTLLAVAIIVSRRPDVLFHAQLWAEDGHIYFQNVYNLGIKRSLILPEAGYFTTFPVLVAWVARFFTITDVPIAMSLLALAVQALPVGILLSHRAETVSTDIRIRALLATVYLVIPNAAELDATAVNSQWFLFVAALLVLVLAPPRRVWWRCLDGAILLLAGLTGPFALLLAPFAVIRRRLRGKAFIPTWEIVVLGGCAVLQTVSLAVISHHDAGSPGVEIRPSPALGASPDLLAKLVGGRVFIGTIIGEASGLSAPIALQWLALIGGLTCVAVAVLSRRQELAFLVVGAAVILAGALASPSAPSPAWPILASLPPNSQRYYFIAECAWVTVLVWVATTPRPVVIRVLAAAAIVTSLAVAVGGHWSIAATPSAGFDREAHVFEQARAGTPVSFPLDPPPWSMTLIKR